ncbi:hypothetical protein HME9302_02642 [Alteripontixanthobacter maritimus]|uniref:Uncharacterized protein n=1 Tax=Alteripontixanthobacter maritimus TaxID=2161824 RepID=A0A369QAQ9_9SPHN|nr:hypothetical protein HME9302_02642 [Alteripontixanthobacter maritimus]
MFFCKFIEQTNGAFAPREDGEQIFLAGQIEPGNHAIIAVPDEKQCNCRVAFAPDRIRDAKGRSR